MRVLWLVSLLAFACARQPELAPPSLAHALSGLPARDPIDVLLHTSEGVIRCQLATAHTPRAVALFVGLARGRAKWWDARHEAVTERPLFRDLPFFRGIADVLVQTGCPLGDGTGQPGFRIPVESTNEDAVRLATPGALLMARYQTPPNRVDPHPPPPGDVVGSQFAVTLANMSHLAGSVTVIGACQDLSIVQRIARMVSAGRSARLSRITFPALTTAPLP